MKAMNTLRLGCAAALFVAATSLFADRPEVPPGHVRYIVVLRDASTIPFPADRSRSNMRTEPDIPGLGGKVEHARGETRVVTLPAPALRRLESDPTVLFIQEVWDGKRQLDAFDGSGEKSARAESGLRTSNDANETFTLQNRGWWASGAYSYDGAGNITQMGDDVFTYDTVGRLTSSTTHGLVETYTYDEYGNLTSNVMAGRYRQPAAINAQSNRWDSALYDVAGNALLDGMRRYEYDGLSMVTKLTSALGQRRRFIYTPNDERIGVQLQEDGWTRWKIRDFENRVIREYEGDTSNAWTWIEDYVYVNGRLVSGRRAGPPLDQQKYQMEYHTDHLGTVRLITNGFGYKVSGHEYYPFGEEQSHVNQENRWYGYSRVSPMKFTAHERDFLGPYNQITSIDYVDYMHARVYNPLMSRFLSVDPVLQVKRAMKNPQLWNRYAYALNNPLIYTDPTGQTVYVVMHTVGNSEGDDELRRAAMTRAAQIRAQKGFDPKTDTVLLRGIASDSSFAKVIAEANRLDPKFGKVGQINLFSHGGPADGPIFQLGGPDQHQSPHLLASVRVNWDRGGSACFYACNSGVNFTQMYATAQGVPAYGFEGSAAFSSTPNEWSLIKPTGPVYMIQTSGWSNGGPWGFLGKWLGFNDGAVPMDRDNP